MKIKNLFVALFATAALLFAGCGKDVKLNGTNWQARVTQDMTEMILEEMSDDPESLAVWEQLIDMMGGKFEVNMDFILAFTDETNGKMTFKMSVANTDKLPAEIGQMIDQMMTQSETENFTYTFDGEKGTITVDNDTENFTYNKSDKTITMSADAEEFGVETLVFSEVK